MKFIRYGSLTPQYHDIKSYDSPHTAPVEYGIYAFPKGYVEPFLLGGIGSGNIKNGRFRFLKDENKKKIIVKPSDFYEICDKPGWSNWLDSKKVKEPYLILLKKQKLNWKDVELYEENEDGVLKNIMLDTENENTYPVVIRNKPTNFEYSGNIWHHLDTCGQDGDIILCKPGYIIRRTEHWILTDIKTYRTALERYISIEKYNLHRGLQGPSSGFPLARIDKDWLEVFIEHV